MTSRPGRSVVGWFAVIVALVVSAAGVTSSGATVGASAALPVVVVSPSTGLVDLQQVTVTGSGFSANAQVASVQCRPGAVGESDCDLSTLVYVRADQNGAFTLKRYVRRLITLTFAPTPTKVDCGKPSGCILGAGNVANLSEASGQAIFFNPNIPPKVPAITVTPKSKLVDHQLVEIDGSGFSPSGSVSIVQCVTKPPPGSGGQVCDYATSRYVSVGDDGTFTAQNFALERLQVYFTKTGSHAVDCAAAPGTCDIEADTFGIGSSTQLKVGLSFDPNVPPVVPAVQVSPSLRLHDLQPLTVTGSGFTPGVAVNVEECSAPSTQPVPACDYTNSRTVTAGFHGEFTITFAAHRNIAAFVFPIGAANTDCATHPNVCELVVQGTESQTPKTAGLTFNPNVAAVTPSISAAPGTNLRDNQRIKVLLRGFTADESVTVVECAAAAITEGGDLSYCDYTTSQITSPTGRGATRTRLHVHRAIAGQAGLVDCAAHPGACVLVAVENGNSYIGGVVVGPSGPTNSTINSPSAIGQRGNGKTVPLKAAPGSNLPNIASTPLTFSSH